MTHKADHVVNTIKTNTMIELNLMDSDELLADMPAPPASKFELLWKRHRTTQEDASKSGR